MKNLRAGIKAMLFVCLTLISSAGFAATAETVASETNRAAAIKERVYELKAMNYSHMSRAERKAVKAEAKQLKNELKQMHPGTYVYIGGGTLIIILILILLLA